MNKTILGLVMALIPLSSMSMPECYNENKLLELSTKYSKKSDNKHGYDITNHFELNHQYYFKLKQINCGMIGHHYYYKFTDFHDYDITTIYNLTDTYYGKGMTGSFLNDLEYKSISPTHMSFFIENQWDVKDFDEDMKTYNTYLEDKKGGKKNLRYDKPLSIDLYDKILKQLKVPGYITETVGNPFEKAYDYENTKYFTNYYINDNKDLFKPNKESIEKDNWSVGLIGQVYVLEGQLYLTQDTWIDHCKYEGYEVNFKTMVVVDSFIGVNYQDGKYYK